MNAAWADLEEHLITFLERQIIVRRFDIVDEPAAVVLHVVIRNLLEAKKLIFGPFFPRTQELHKVKADRIRLVIDDLRVLCATVPDLLRDTTFLTFLTFQLGRSGITSLLVYSDAVRPDTRPTDEATRSLLALAKKSILLWRVPFEGHSRFALTLVPPAYTDRVETVREFKLISPKWDLGGSIGTETTLTKDRHLDEAPGSITKSKSSAIFVPVVTPHFELYSGIEKGQPSPVPLAVYIYAETEETAAYVEEENALFRELFTSVEAGSAAKPGPVIFPLDWARYLAMRDYSHLSLDKLDNHTMIFQVDSCWAANGKGALLPQEHYLTDHFSADEEVRAAQDPFGLFHDVSQKKQKREDFFTNSHYKVTFQVGNSSQRDRVPFAWDFGFILARSAPWVAAFDESFSGRLPFSKVQDTNRIPSALINVIEEIVPFQYKEEKTAHSRNRVYSLWTRLANPVHASYNSPISWRKFLGACRSVADIHKAQTGAKAVAFDLSASSPETINCLILEIWFSEILLEQQLRSAAHGKPWTPNYQFFERSLEDILLDSSKSRIESAFEEFSEQYKEYVGKIVDDLLPGKRTEENAPVRTPRHR